LSRIVLVFETDRLGVWPEEWLLVKILWKYLYLGR